MSPSAPPSGGFPLGSLLVQAEPFFLHDFPVNASEPLCALPPVAGFSGFFYMSGEPGFLLSRPVCPALDR